ncbi:MAG: radical SAM protein [Candidatus Berkelbacteria bacterium]|nr:radical SAM protein [Candidatus Berkelbacteria bacterium]
MEYIKRKSLLYKSGVEYADYGLNHVEGCSHGCNFPCYAFMIKKRCGVVKTYQEWIQPKIVENALELLDAELPKLKDKIKCVFLCFMTDPFMYKQPEITDLTLKILARLKQDDVKSTVISKGIYPKELLDKSIYNENNDYGSTIVSLSEDYRKKFEPGSAPIKERIKALKRLHNAGLKTWVSMEPYPTPNIVKQDVREILKAVSFVDKIVFGKWNYNKRISAQPSSKNFYNSMAGYVIDFCNKRGIEYHIKDGTISEGCLSEEKVNKDQIDFYLKSTQSTSSSKAMLV